MSDALGWTPDASRFAAGRPVTRPSWTERFRSIVFEGPIGVGKSSLALKFATRFGYTPLLEAPDQNPFLSRFYRDSARYALSTQLFFLFQRMDQLREVSQRDMFEEHLVSDFMIEKDPLFASLTLSEEELGLYQKIYESLRPQAPTPDLVIVLQASAEQLSDRIRQRGIDMEQGMSADYLTRLSEAYTQYFHRYEEAPLLIVNTAALNPIDREEDFEALVAQVASLKGRRTYFNLMP